MKIVMLAISLWMLASAAVAEEPQTKITFLVKDRTSGKPIPRAEVRLRRGGEDNRFFATFSTGDNGEATRSIARDARVFVNVHKSGYKFYEMRIADHETLATMNVRVHMRKQ